MARVRWEGYVRHFGLLNDDQMASFDNRFFGISEDEAIPHALQINVERVWIENCDGSRDLIRRSPDFGPLVEDGWKRLGFDLLVEGGNHCSCSL